MPSRTAAEQARLARFAREYENSQQQVFLDIERAVCGCDYGGTSWTTREEAERVARILGLGPGIRFLEVGAGSGWPGLYLGRVTGCDVALADIPLQGLSIAARRAGAEPLAGACWVIAADGAALPLQSAAFDAISHSDVLCCLLAKDAVLRECRRVIRPGGRMVFTVIAIAQGLSAGDYRRAVAAAPAFGETSAAYPTLLQLAGWKIVQHEDLTPGYRRAARHMLRASGAHADALIKILGDAEFSDMLARRRRTVRALDEGLLRRELIAAEPTIPFYGP